MCIALTLGARQGVWISCPSLIIWYWSAPLLPLLSAVKALPDCTQVLRKATSQGIFSVLQEQVACCSHIPCLVSLSQVPRVSTKRAKATDDCQKVRVACLATCCLVSLGA